MDCQTTPFSPFSSLRSGWTPPLPLPHCMNSSVSFHYVQHPANTRYLHFALPSSALTPPPSLNLLPLSRFQSILRGVSLGRRLAALRRPSPFILPPLPHSLMKSGPRRGPHSATVFLDTPTIYHFVRETLKVPGL